MFYLQMFLMGFGVYATFLWAYNTFLESLLGIVWGTIKGWFSNKPLTEKYGPWAVITGATDGIGKRYAEILASKGMNIMLLSRSEPKLMKVAHEINESYNVQTRWVAVDFSKGPEIYQMIREQVEGLDIGILVNNVGYYPEVRSFDRNTEEEIVSTININILSTTMMSRMVLPGMKQRRRGIIVNISSIGCYRPAAFLNMYASAKAFVTNFSLALNHELLGKGVKCQAVVPGMTHTNMIKHLEKDIPWYVGVTTSDALAKFGVFSLGKTAHTTGGWKHTLQVCWQDLVPYTLGMAIISFVTKKAIGK
ncbi:inactive hydroxysteroid dehydrogenase-like protein 1 isoform X1 [Aedes aegypti]|uniref:Steroid dehydrogenase n=1 Tax=Aedes aegypti TaxID=7159 RepID=A0A6I8TRS9_AEDAE|nr:inactive hydroxysteroid dehydrogenase-like protein 1 isoform X1 [Aedes aegypti]